MEAVCDTGNKCFWLYDVLEDIDANCMTNSQKVARNEVINMIQFGDMYLIAN